ncbi:hypothetical protein TrCOL_g5249 [Triparma columacea]|uniref:Uncharacterized protein n=1 Tax=Triparma columacea TaxID=722753 RepID=A0A9W7G340_9STRA|nr:hypothetical protein TrCOL_g5249 [Triparma columacea]
MTSGMRVTKLSAIDIDEQEAKEISMQDYSEQQLSVFSSSTRLLGDRRYAKRRPYLPENIHSIPTILDVSPPRKLSAEDPERWWLSFQFRGSIVFGAYVAFPYILQLVAQAVDVTDDLNYLVSSFIPSVSILFGTLCSLTVNILYSRQARLQQTVSEEASLLSQLTQDLLHLLRRPEHSEHKKRAAQAAADYVATLVGDSRGVEIMKVVISDPIMQMTDTVVAFEQYCEDKGTDLQAAGALVSSLRSNLSEIGVLRARRLSDEALALPPTHFGLLALLSGLILAAFILTSLGSVDMSSGMANPSIESRVLFSVISGVYTLFFNFSRDLNQPFGGVYQIRRSQTASYLLKTKRIITSAGLAQDVNFGYGEDGSRIQ